MKITQHELEQIMHEQLLKQIHIMYSFRELCGASRGS